MPEDPRQMHARALGREIRARGNPWWLFAGKQFQGELSAVDADGFRWDEVVSEDERTEFAVVVGRVDLPDPWPEVGEALTLVETGERHTVYGREDVPTCAEVTFFLGKGVPA